MKHGEPQESDFVMAETFVKSSLPVEAGTVELHTKLSSHAVQQMQQFQGIGDTLEDVVEQIHQISAKMDARVSQLKAKASKQMPFKNGSHPDLQFGKGKED
jgi:hypothetical protein